MYQYLSQSFATRSEHLVRLLEVYFQLDWLSFELRLMITAWRVRSKRDDVQVEWALGSPLIARSARLRPASPSIHPDSRLAQQQPVCRAAATAVELDGSR